MLNTRTVLVLVMLLTLSPRCDAAPHTPSECCFNYVKNPVQKAILKSFYKTPMDCFNPAIVFETRNGAKICANPESSWVEKAVTKLQKMKGLHAP
ncbi:C-C motif chemokine 5-like [Phalacrocorax aristotelis]|uniref:C-C motif chemokine 5-like n=1 Tax=Phalacrocorax aristotelis TaxID=126867 RepID=UPI003F4BD7D8